MRIQKELKCRFELRAHLEIWLEDGSNKMKRRRGKKRVPEFTTACMRATAVPGNAAEGGSWVDICTSTLMSAKFYADIDADSSR